MGWKRRIRKTVELMAVYIEWKYSEERMFIYNIKILLNLL
jgi:hypothetical protein